MDDYGIDEYGRLTPPTVGGGAMLAGLVGLSGPIIPPLPTDHARSPKWPAFLHHFLSARPACDGCGRHAVTGHHVVPFHVDRSQELVESNIAAVCLPCHFVLCHAGDWRLVIPPQLTRNRLASNLTVVRQVSHPAGDSAG